MSHRALVFNVPKGNEVHYSKIQGKILGKVRAPLYHSYSYYVPANKFPQRMHTAAHIMLEEPQHRDSLGALVIVVWVDLVLAMRFRWRGLVWSRIHVCHVGWARHVWILPYCGPCVGVLCVCSAQIVDAKNDLVDANRAGFARAYPSWRGFRVCERLVQIRVWPRWALQ